MQIQKHEPKLEILTKDGDRLLVSAAKKSEILNTINDSRFIEIEGVILSVFEIRKIQPASAIGDLADFPVDVREKVAARAKIYLGSLNKKPPLEKKIEWAQKIARGEEI